jgi:hypothetical protein
VCVCERRPFTEREPEKSKSKSNSNSNNNRWENDLKKKTKKQEQLPDFCCFVFLLSIAVWSNESCVVNLRSAVSHTHKIKRKRREKKRRDKSEKLRARARPVWESKRPRWWWWCRWCGTELCSQRPTAETRAL